MGSATDEYVPFVSDGFLFTSLDPPRDLAEGEERIVTLGGCIDVLVSREAIWSSFDTFFLKVCRYRCRIFSRIRRTLLAERGIDIRTHCREIEPLISPDLEVLLLTLALLRNAPINIMFYDANPGAPPEGRQPLEVERLVGPHPLYEEADTDHKGGDIRHVPFHFVHVGGEAHAPLPLSDGGLPVQSVFQALRALVDAQDNAVARRLLAGLYYLRRALFLEAHGMYNEAFLTFYKIIELHLRRGARRAGTRLGAAAAADALEAEAADIRAAGRRVRLGTIRDRLQDRLGMETQRASFEKLIDESGLLQVPGVENTVADKDRLMRLPDRRSSIEAHAREDVWDTREAGEVRQVELTVCRWFAMYLLRRDLGVSQELQRALLA